MTRRNPSLGLFGAFGRSEDLRSLERALRVFDLHPNLVPDAVKLAALNVLKDERGEDPKTEDYAEAAALIAYCALGRQTFLSSNGTVAASAAERRIEAALETGDGLDASLILLALHSAIMHPALKDAYQFESG
ncbi:MAG: hypothetical protein WAN43_06725 [Rhodomicrobium sp.]|jgi:hypothetical protein